MPGIKIRATSFNSSVFKEIGPEVAGKLRPLVLKYLTMVSNRAAELVPKRTGATSKSFHVVHVDAPGAYEEARANAEALDDSIVFDGPARIEKTGLQGFVYNPAKHFHILEVGGPKNPARPSLVPAHEEIAPGFVEETEAVLAKYFKGKGVK